MSSNDQVIVAPFPGDLSRYAVWHDYCVDNPFNFAADPIAVFDNREAALVFAHEQADGYIDEALGCFQLPAEYGVRFISKEKVGGYSQKIWDEFPDYEYLGIDAPSSERR